MLPYPYPNASRDRAERKKIIRRRKTNDLAGKAIKTEGFWRSAALNNTQCLTLLLFYYYFFVVVVMLLLASLFSPVFSYIILFSIRKRKDHNLTIFMTTIVRIRVYCTIDGDGTVSGSLWNNKYILLYLYKCICICMCEREKERI